jgi:hypothetical protein
MCMTMGVDGRCIVTVDPAGTAPDHCGIPCSAGGTCATGFQCNTTHNVCTPNRPGGMGGFGGGMGGAGGSGTGGSGGTGGAGG